MKREQMPCIFGLRSLTKTSLVEDVCVAGCPNAN